MELNGSSVLLTGASGPTGQVIARALHAQGANLKVSARNVEVLEGLKRDLGGERVEVVAGNLDKPEDARALAERAAPVDILVSFAGISPVGEIEDHPTDEVDRLIDLNLHAPMHLVQALLPGMKERGRGQLVFFSSISGKSPSKGRSLYSAGCYGIRGIRGLPAPGPARHGRRRHDHPPGADQHAGRRRETGIQPRPPARAHREGGRPRHRAEQARGHRRAAGNEGLPRDREPGPRSPPADRAGRQGGGSRSPSSVEVAPMLPV